MLSIGWILLKWDDGRGHDWFWVWVIGATVCTGLSGLLYVWDGVRQLSAHPTSSPTKNKPTEF
jgi:hypothetical protein